MPGARAPTAQKRNELKRNTSLHLRSCVSGPRNETNKPDRNEYAARRCPCMYEGFAGDLCDEVTENFCPNQCSGHGDCYLGWVTNLLPPAPRCGAW